MAESGAVRLATPDDTARCGRQVAQALLALRPSTFVLNLGGDLGAGKTTLARGLLEELGHRGRVPSPTYTLVEPYEVAGYRVYHVDLYRLRNPHEVADLALTDQLSEGSIALIEWPDHGTGFLPPPDLELRLSQASNGRLLSYEPRSNSGRQLLRSLPWPDDATGGGSDA